MSVEMQQLGVSSLRFLEASPRIQYTRLMAGTFSNAIDAQLLGTSELGRTSVSFPSPLNYLKY